MQENIINEFYVDKSTFQGIIEFDTPIGILSFHSKSKNIFSVYELKNDSYIHVAQIRIKGKINCKKLYESYMDLYELELYESYLNDEEI